MPVVFINRKSLIILSCLRWRTSPHAGWLSARLLLRHRNSHDLMLIISSYLKLLEKRYKDRLDSDANEFIDFAVDGATRMQVLIDDLLAYSRVGTKGSSFSLTATEKLLEHVLSYLELAIRESGTVITYD